MRSFGFFCEAMLLLWQSVVASLARSFGCFCKVTLLLWQSHCASLAMSLRFWGEWSKLLVFCEGNCWGNVLLVRGGVWSGFFACRMLVGRFVETACWRFLLYWRSVRNLEKGESDASENTNETLRKLEMKCFENYGWPCVIPYE